MPETEPYLPESCLFHPSKREVRRPRPGLFIMAITLNSVILSRALAFAFPTRFFCGSGERGVEGSAVSSAIMPILTNHRSLDSARAAHPGKSRRDAILARASLGMTIQCLLP